MKCLNLLIYNQRYYLIEVYFTNESIFIANEYSSYIMSYLGESEYIINSITKRVQMMDRLLDNINVIKNITKDIRNSGIVLIKLYSFTS